jgi:hypothetical protein
MIVGLDWQRYHLLIKCVPLIFLAVQVLTIPILAHPFDRRLKHTAISAQTSSAIEV